MTRHISQTWAEYRVAFIAALMLVLIAPSAQAFVDPPWITPANPRAGENVSANIRMGVCDAIVFRMGYPQIARQGNEIRILEYGDRVPSEDFCIYPILTTTDSIGSFPPGDYVLTVDLVYDNYPFGYATTTLGVVPFTVTGLTSAAAVPTLAVSWRFALLISISGAAFLALRRRRRSAPM